MAGLTASQNDTYVRALGVKLWQSQRYPAARLRFGIAEASMHAGNLRAYARNPAPIGRAGAESIERSIGILRPGEERGEEENA